MKQHWNGNLPVSSVQLLPEAYQTARLGLIQDQDSWTRLWTAFRPEEEVPGVNFESEVVVIVKNVGFLNRIDIDSVEVVDGVAHIRVHETKTARPIDKLVGCAMLVLKKGAIRQISCGDQAIPLGSP